MWKTTVESVRKRRKITSSFLKAGWHTWTYVWKFESWRCLSQLNRDLDISRTTIHNINCDNKYRQLKMLKVELTLHVFLWRRAMQATSCTLLWASVRQVLRSPRNPGRPSHSRCDTPGTSAHFLLLLLLSIVSMAVSMPYLHVDHTRQAEYCHLNKS